MTCDDDDDEKCDLSYQNSGIFLLKNKYKSKKISLLFAET